MSAETDIAAIEDGGKNTAAEVRAALTSVLGRTGGYPTFSGTRVSLASDASIAHSSNVTVDWTSEVFDTDTYHDNSTNPSRLTVPATGYYVSTGGLVWDTNTSGHRFAFIQINGSGNFAYSSADAIVRSRQTISTGPLLLTAGDYLTIVVNQNSGFTRSLITDSFWSVWRIA